MSHSGFLWVDRKIGILGTHILWIELELELTYYLTF